MTIVHLENKNIKDYLATITTCDELNEIEKMINTRRKEILNEATWEKT